VAQGVRSVDGFRLEQKKIATGHYYRLITIKPKSNPKKGKRHVQAK
jgi:hypothetical protein